MADVCEVDGVDVVEARGGRLVHTAELPKHVDPDHDIVNVTAEAYYRRRRDDFDLKGAAEDMLAHHAALHPADGCAWATRLSQAIRGS